MGLKSERERAESKTIRELRKKNERLAIEVRRLRKQLRQTEREISESEEDELVEPEVTVAAKDKKNKCPKCYSENIRVFKLRDRDYYICDDCCSKGRFNK